MSGFVRAGVWPVDPSRVLSEPLPAHSKVISKVFSVEELMKMMYEKFASDVTSF